ncbi:hypothetical protein M0811_02008 [Anaeramoeba ignava]|uniref:Uncharacterized protein n=1 Tax=Anaeramoeba ignava TaxID=1746090 RepID=A0A9Q0LE45_ANAIG|nr:hypothetical protein M0811_02008 [Anaeramoeba ignava]
MNNTNNFFYKFFSHQNKKYLLIFFVILNLGVFFQSWRRYNHFLSRSVPPNQNINNLCACNSSHFACSKSLSHQFDKFIWFIIDSYPYKRFERILPTYEDHSIIFTVSVSGMKWSHAIFSCWWTGMPPTNYFATTINGDNLFQAINRASKSCSNQNQNQIQNQNRNQLENKNQIQNQNQLENKNQNQNQNPNFKLKFVGTEWPLLTVLGGKEKINHLFDEIEIIKDQDCYPHNYPEIQDPIILNQKLKDVRSKNQSLIMYSSIFDHETHTGNRDRLNFLDNSAVELFKKDTLVNFIKENPDYLLILSSDHGESISQFHGESETLPTKNIGFFLFYHPDFQYQKWTQIKDVDITATLTSFLKSVDIPFFSFGKIGNSYISRNLEDEYKIELMRNIIQLKNVANYYEKEIEPNFYYPYQNQNEFDQFLQSSSVETLSKIADLYQEIIYFPIIPIHRFDMIFLIILCVSISLILLILNYENLIIEIFTLIWTFWPLLTLWYQFKTLYMDTNKIYLITHLGITLVLIIYENQRFYILFIELLSAIILFINIFDPFSPSIYQKIGLIIISFIIYLIQNKFQNQNRSQNQEQNELEHQMEIIQKSQTKLKQNKETIIVLILHIFIILFFITQDINWFYFLFDFHIFAFGFYSIIFGIMITSFIKKDTKIGVEALCWMIFILQNCNPRAILINIQFRFFISKFGKTQINEMNKQKRLQLIQILSIYYLDYILYSDLFLGKQTLDWNVDVTPGEVGITSWNLYPIFSAFLMFIGKTGTLIIPIIYSIIFLKNYIFSLLLLLLEVSISSLALIAGIAVFRIPETSPIAEMFTLLTIYSIILIILILIHFFQEFKNFSQRNQNRNELIF